MIQNIIVWILFSIAVGYLAKGIYRVFYPKRVPGCAKGCGSCQTSKSMEWLIEKK